MKITGNTNFNFGGGLRQVQTEEEQTATQTTSLAVDASNLVQRPEETKTRSSHNLLENNFVQQNYEQSKYAQGLLDGIKSNNALNTQMFGLIESYSNIAAATDSYAEKALAGQKAAEKVADVIESKIAESEEKRLEKERQEDEEKIEQKLEEKMTNSSKEASDDESTASGISTITDQASEATTASEKAVSTTEKNESLQNKTDMESPQDEQNINATIAARDEGTSNDDSTSHQSVDMFI